MATSAHNVDRIMPLLTPEVTAQDSKAAASAAFAAERTALRPHDLFPQLESFAQKLTMDNPELDLEALAHLSAQRNTGEDNVSSFLSSDLSLDVEISLEWENPLCTVTFFTQPRSLTIDDAFRYLGLTFSKRFVF